MMRPLTFDQHRRDLSISVGIALAKLAVYEGCSQRTNHLNLWFAVDGRFYRHEVAAPLPIEENEKLIILAR